MPCPECQVNALKPGRMVEFQKDEPAAAWLPENCLVSSEPPMFRFDAKNMAGTFAFRRGSFVTECCDDDGHTTLYVFSGRVTVKGYKKASESDECYEVDVLKLVYFYLKHVPAEYPGENLLVPKHRKP